MAAVLSEARHLRWLPTTAAQVPACARMHVPPYVRELLRETLLAVARALSLDAATKADPKLQDVRAPLPSKLHCTHLCCLGQERLGMAQAAALRWSVRTGGAAATGARQALCGVPW